MRLLVLIFCAAFSAFAGTIFHVNLTGAAENPDVITPATGLAIVSLSADQNSLTVHVEFAGLKGPTIDGHIHCCQIDPTKNVGVAIGFTPSGFPIGVTSGTYDHVFDLTDPTIYSGGKTQAIFLAGLLSGGAYVNVHSTEHRGGEIRGQLTPEPSTWMLAGVALAGLGLIRRKA